MGAEDKLREMGLVLPEMAAPAGAYVPGKRTGNLVYVAGQLPLKGMTTLKAGATSVELLPPETCGQCTSIPQPPDERSRRTFQHAFGISPT